MNARELHEKLKVGRDFSSWVKGRLSECGLVAGVDFVLTKMGEPGFTTKIDYHLTIEAAKHLAMLERNAQGKLVRQYFIDFEKTARKVLPKKTFEELTLEVVLGLKGKVEALQLQLEAQAPSVLAWSKLMDADQGLSVSQAAKALCDSHGFTIGRKRLFELLREWKWINKNNEPYQSAVEVGYCKIIFVTVGGAVFPKLLIFGKGLSAIANKLRRLENADPSKIAGKQLPTYGNARCSTGCTCH